MLNYNRKSEREGVPTLGRSLSFDFCDYGTTIKRLSTIRAIDFLATFRLSGDYRLCDYQRLSATLATFCRLAAICAMAAAGASVELSCGSTFGAVFRVEPRRFHLGRAAAGRQDDARWRFMTFLWSSGGVLTSWHTVDRVSRSLHCAPCTWKIDGIGYCMTDQEPFQIVRVALYSPQDAR